VYTYLKALNYLHKYIPINCKIPTAVHVQNNQNIAFEDFFHRKMASACRYIHICLNFLHGHRNDKNEYQKAGKYFHLLLSDPEKDFFAFHTKEMN
jgi:hypothetical protein